jgi:thioredoxin 1
MNTLVINVKTLEEYNKYLNNNLYVVANFSASFCNPCKEILPFIKELIINYPNIQFLKIDIEDGNEISDYYNISSIPYFKFYKNNVETSSYCGTDKKIIIEALKSLIDN